MRANCVLCRYKGWASAYFAVVILWLSLIHLIRYFDSRFVCQPTPSVIIGTANYVTTLNRYDGEQR